MNIADRCDSIARFVASRAMIMEKKLHEIVRAEGYSDVIAGPVRDLAQGTDRDLLIEQLDLMQCAFSFRSSLFPLPVHCLFSIDPSQMQTGIAETWQWGDLSNTLGEDLRLRCGPVHIVFALDKRNRRCQPRPHSNLNVLVVDESLLAQCGTYPQDYGDTHLQSALKPFAVPRFGKCGDEIARRLVVAILTIRFLAHASGLHKCSSWHAFICPTMDDQQFYSGSFAFFFKNSLTAEHRLVMRCLADHLSASVLLLDSRESQRRSASLQAQFHTRLSELHEVRNALGILGNKLYILRVCGQEIHMQYITDAARAHSDVLRSLDRLETSALTPISPGPQFKLRTLANLWCSEWKLPARFRVKIDKKWENDSFEIRNSIEELGRLLLQFIEGATLPRVMTDKDVDSPIPFEESDPGVYIGYDPSHECLRVIIQTDRLFPAKISTAIRSIDFTGRLPSGKDQGGRGILSAIATIRYKYGGNCDFANDPNYGARWSVVVPIRLSLQYHLFE